MAVILLAGAVPAGLGCEQVLGLEWTPSARDEGAGGAGGGEDGGDGGSHAASVGVAGDGGSAESTGSAGGGAPKGCLSSLDCPVPTEACRVAICEQGSCGWVGMSVGLACGAGVCDGAGSCVACNVDADCSGGDLCKAHVCANDCPDGAKNGVETDVDCGGGECPKCNEGSSCLVDSDCKKKHCRDSICKEQA